MPSVRFLLTLLDNNTLRSGANEKDSEDISESQQKELKAMNRKSGLKEIKRIKQMIR